MSSSHLVLCCPLLLLPLVFPTIRVFFNELALPIRWPKYRRFNFSISPSNEYSGLIAYRIDLFDLLAVQGTLKSLLQHDSSKASVLQCSTFFMVQLSHPYMTTGKTIASIHKHTYIYLIYLVYHICMIENSSMSFLFLYNGNHVHMNLSLPLPNIEIHVCVYTHSAIFVAVVLLLCL